DLPDGHDVDVLAVEAASPPRDADGAVMVAAQLRRPVDRVWPYSSAGDAHGPPGDPAEGAEVAEVAEVALHPYHDWATRGPATMRVWLPVAGEMESSTSSRQSSSTE